MPSAALCTEAEIPAMVHAFYADVRWDAVLGPIFKEHEDDWGHHLAKLVDFWSWVLRGTGRFSGTPMPKQAALPGLTPELFLRWLALFRETTAALPNRAMGQQASHAGSADNPQPLVRLSVEPQSQDHGGGLAS